ncbi:class I SAM-dependent methyltransferase [Cryobacterium sp. TMS1-13-1]|uniref:class I SAM-dependent methyltransferase n=1 Tax=Cryobacterium sp. TMS1-13-1 TaxID=1259220 RepID=UPI00106AFAF9|nr:class I SAM-dependent methyltransferase [Cryobacterium sp. TMS1-13-1]TFD22216.1 class I SAM-dependent methyltransferase [Cryobacterium sp. TMS1-13-1]
MDRTELVELLSPASLRLLDSLPPYEANGDVLKLVSELRKAGHAPGLVSAVLSQSRLRAKAVAKFGEFAERMLFTEAGLEQATRLRVAALHAGRFAGLEATLGRAPRVADLGCGIGGDAMALAAMDLPVVAVDADEVTATVASYNLAPFPNASALQADAETVDLTDFDAVWLDPARRTSGHSNTKRLTRSEDYSPSLDFAYLLAATLPLGMKLGPGHDRDQIPVDAEAQWVSVDGQVVEMGLWFGALARPGIRRSALLLTRDGVQELSNDADSEDEPVGELGHYVYEPDGAVIRARLIGDLARSMKASMLSEGIAYLTNDILVPTPFATAFRVLETLSFDEKKLRLALLERRIGTLEIKKRGVDVDPATLRTRLKLKGPEVATLILTRVAGHRVALLVERVR